MFHQPKNMENDNGEVAGTPDEYLPECELCGITKVYKESTGWICRNKECPPTPAAAQAGETGRAISGYLQAGGLFNPEMMKHDKVRDLLMRCRDELATLREQLAESRSALLQHHQWHLDQTERSPVYFGDSIGQINADEYSDSEMYEETTKALADYKPEEITQDANRSTSGCSQALPIHRTSAKTQALEDSIQSLREQLAAAEKERNALRDSAWAQEAREQLAAAKGELRALLDTSRRSIAAAKAERDEAKDKLGDLLHDYTIKNTQLAAAERERDVARSFVKVLKDALLLRTGLAQERDALTAQLAAVRGALETIYGTGNMSSHKAARMLISEVCNAALAALTPKP